MKIYDTQQTYSKKLLVNQSEMIISTNVNGKLYVKISTHVVSVKIGNRKKYANELIFIILTKLKFWHEIQQNLTP